MVHIETSALIPAEKTQVFDYLTNPRNLPELLKGHIDVDLIHIDQPLKRGSEYQLIMSRYGISQPVTLRVEDWLRGTRLVYRQNEGMFNFWVHTMKFEDHGDHQTRVSDYVDYELPFGILGHLANDLYVRGNMKQILLDRFEQAKSHFSKVSNVAN